MSNKINDEQILNDKSFTKKIKDDVKVLKEGIEKNTSVKLIAILACVASGIWFLSWSFFFTTTLTLHAINCVTFIAIAVLLLVSWIKVQKNTTIKYKKLIQPFLLVGWIIAFVCFGFAVAFSIGYSGGTVASWISSIAWLPDMVGSIGLGLSVAATVLSFIAYSKGHQHA
ncbi:MAG: hypothetical protein LBS76_04865 [Mycoplasmataceae bacterium]|nr:hypothetical protein [Mycoplasmataceae bacterium]